MLALNLVPGDPGLRSVKLNAKLWLIVHGDEQIALISDGGGFYRARLISSPVKRTFTTRTQARDWVRDTAALEPVRYPVITGRVDYSGKLWIVVQNVLPPRNLQGPHVLVIDNDGNQEWKLYRTVFDWLQMNKGHEPKLEEMANRLFGRLKWRRKMGRFYPNSHAFTPRRTVKDATRRRRDEGKQRKTLVHHQDPFKKGEHKPRYS